MVWIKRNIHTVPHKGGWANRRAWSFRVLSTHETQEAAIAYGRQVARRDKVEHLIHGEDGKIRARQSYGNDPYPPRG